MCYYIIDEIPSFFSSHSISSIINNSLSHLSIEFGFGFEGEFVYIDTKVAELIIIKKWEALLKQI